MKVWVVCSKSIPVKNICVTGFPNILFSKHYRNIGLLDIIHYSPTISIINTSLPKEHSAFRHNTGRPVSRFHPFFSQWNKCQTISILTFLLLFWIPATPSRYFRKSTFTATLSIHLLSVLIMLLQILIIDMICIRQNMWSGEITLMIEASELSWHLSVSVHAVSK